MTSLDESALARELGQLLRDVFGKGVTLWSENGELRYRAPRGALGPEDINRLRMLRKQIVAFLEASASRRTAIPELARRRALDVVPLTFSQLKYWNSDRLGERRTVRSVAAVARLQGTLDLGLLRECIAEIVRRHEALRTCIVARPEGPTQQIVEASCELPFNDLSAVAARARAAEAEGWIHELIMAPVYVGVGPLFAARVARVEQNEYLLAVAMEHIISDGASVGVLLRDLAVAYQQGSQGRPLALPPIGVQLADFAVWQRKAHETWLKLHAPYWAQRLAGCERLRFPQDDAPSVELNRRCTSIPIMIDESIRTALAEWCRVRKTTLVMTVFAMFAALMLRTCKRSDAVVRFQSDGRLSPLLENSIGYFACVLNLRIELRDSDSFLDLLGRVIDEYCTASGHADFSYIDAQLPQPDFTRNCAFNWVPQARGGRGTEDYARCKLRFLPHEFTPPPVEPDGYEWDHEPVLLLFDNGTSIHGKLLFSPMRNSVRTMEAFRDNLATLVRELLRDAQQRVASLALQ
jgi:hypothetical protein